jgi:predicted CopG family antitoxin
VLKTINVAFDNDEYDKLVELKDGSSWHDFIMKLVEAKTP